MRITLPLLLLPLPIVTACATPFPAYGPADDGTASLSDRFPHHPKGTRMTLRAILEYRGMELPMTFRILRMLPDSDPAMVTDDLGGSVMHVVDHESRFTILARAKTLPEPFVRSLGHDLAAWLFVGPQPHDRMVRLADGTPALLQSVGPATEALLRSTKAGRPIDRILVGNGGRLTTEIGLEWDEGRPGQVRIENHESGYTVDLEVREWQPAEDLTPSKFRTTR